MPLSCNLEKFHHISTDEVYGSLNYDDTELFKETIKLIQEIHIQQVKHPLNTL